MYNTKSFILCTAAVYWLISSNAVIVKSNILNLTKKLNELHQSVFITIQKIYYITSYKNESSKIHIKEVGIYSTWIYENT